MPRLTLQGQGQNHWTQMDQIRPRPSIGALARVVVLPSGAGGYGETWRRECISVPGQRRLSAYHRATSEEEGISHSSHSRTRAAEYLDEISWVRRREEFGGMVENGTFVYRRGKQIMTLMSDLSTPSNVFFDAWTHRDREQASRCACSWIFGLDARRCDRRQGPRRVPGRE